MTPALVGEACVELSVRLWVGRYSPHASADGTVIRASWLCLASNDKGGSKPGSSLTPVLGRRLESGLAQKPGFHLQQDVCGGEFAAKVEVCVVIAGIWFVDNIDQAVDGADLSLGQIAKGFFACYLAAARLVIGFKRFDMFIHGEVRSGRSLILSRCRPPVNGDRGRSEGRGEALVVGQSEFAGIDRAWNSRVNRDIFCA